MNDWKNLTTPPPTGELVEVKGSDFMGEWTTTAKWKQTHPTNRQRGRFIGTGWMGTKPRELGKGDVEAWRPLPKKTETP